MAAKRMHKEFESSLLCEKSVGDKELDLSAEEWTFSFHTVAPLSKFAINGLYLDSAVTCVETKIPDIVVNVHSPQSIRQTREELEHTKCISVITD
jgi:hypothetical protein